MVMKTYIQLTFLGFAMLFFTSCEDKITVNLNDAPPRLVIEASLDWQKGSSGNDQTIALSLSTPFFDTTVNNEVLGASVKVTNNDTQEVISFIDQNNGLYSTSNFNPILNNSYSLEVIYNGETYVATETLTKVSEISRVEQSLEGGFDEEVLDVTIFFDDPIEADNFYFIRFIEEGDLFPILETLSDEFINGNEIDVFFEKDGEEGTNEAEFIPGDTVTMTLFGISESYFNYLDMLIEQYDSDGNPFSATPSRIKGNCVNLTNPEKYAFGYFRLTEFDKVNYTFE